MEDAYRHDDLTPQIDVPPHRRINVMSSLGGQASRYTRLHWSSSSPILQNLFLGIDTSHLRILSELRRTCRPAFHGLARGLIVGSLGDTQTPAIPIRWPDSFDVHRTGPTYRPSSTYVHHVSPHAWLPIVAEAL